MNKDQAKNNLRRNLRILMWDKRLKQKDVAKVLGLTTATISNFTNGRTAISSEYLAKLSEVYGVSIDWLLLNHGEMYIDGPERICA